MVRAYPFPARSLFPALPRIPGLSLVLVLVLAGPALLPVAAARAQAPDPATLAAFRQDPMSFFFQLRQTDAVACSQELLQSPDVPDREREQVLTALAAVHLASGRPDQARAAVMEMLTRNPTTELARPETLPPPLVTLFYGIRDSLLLATEPPPDQAPVLDVHTLAVGDIENNSLVAGKFNLDAFAKGLTQILITDLREATPLKLVDRQRLNVLRDEIQMNQNSQITDPRYRVPMGRLTGAQSFLFGSLMQVDEKHVRLDLRWVDTATGQILLADGVEGKLGSSDDLFKLERAVLLERLVPRLKTLLGDDPAAGELKKTMERRLNEKKKSLPGNSSYVQLLLETGNALLAEDRGDMAAAQQAWDAVARLDPADRTAEGRVTALNAYLAMGSGEGQ